jgi:hypothetical protein
MWMNPPNHLLGLLRLRSKCLVAHAEISEHCQSGTRIILILAPISCPAKPPGNGFMKRIHSCDISKWLVFAVAWTVVAGRGTTSQLRDRGRLPRIASIEGCFAASVTASSRQDLLTIEGTLRAVPEGPQLTAVDRTAGATDQAGPDDAGSVISPVPESCA